MLTFCDLTFIPTGKMMQAILRFKNGYGVSVLSGPETISDDRHPYELAVIHFNSEGNFSIVYPSFTDNDTVGHLDESDVTRYMELTQSL